MSSKTKKEREGTGGSRNGKSSNNGKGKRWSRKTKKLKSREEEAVGTERAVHAVIRAEVKEAVSRSSSKNSKNGRAVGAVGAEREGSKSGIVHIEQ